MAIDEDEINPAIIPGSYPSYISDLNFIQAEVEGILKGAIGYRVNIGVFPLLVAAPSRGKT